MSNFISKLKQRHEEIATGTTSAAAKFIRQTSTVVASAADTVATAVKERVIQPVIVLDEVVVLKRYNTCLDCEQFNAQTARCNMCGCYMKLKTKLTAATCPLGKW